MGKSNKRKFLSLFNLMIIFAVLSFISACGGGGGGGTDTGGNTTAINHSTLTLTTSSNSVTFGTPVTITATLTDADGDAAPNTVVTFATADAIVAFTPVAGTALTDANGIATITLNAASIDSNGATSITASAPVTFSGATVTTTSAAVGISVGGVAVTLGTFTVATSPISAYGTSSVSVPVLVGGSAATVPIEVTFTSPCVSSGKALLSSPVTSSAGIATSTYTDNGCASGTTAITDTITAASGDATSLGTIAINPTAVNNISFVSATPAVIGTKTANSSTLLKSSAVKFQVRDNKDQGKPGVGVSFSLLPANYSSMGITFTPATATSDADGYVTVFVYSGTVPTPVSVVAIVNGSSPVIQTQSNNLTITTGLPTQNSFSLAVSTFNIEGLNYNDVTSILSVIASDRFGSSVPDGTMINFITEGGNISGGSVATCTTTNGRCTVTFASANKKPADGRVTIVAYALGEESFLDNNFNNYFDSGDTCYDLGDVYVDWNESASWNSGEDVIPYGSGSSACPATTFAVPSKANTCTGTCENNYVRRSTVIVLSGSVAYISPDNFPAVGSCFGKYDFWLTDENNNPMPAGTTVSINSSFSNVNYSYTASQGTPPTTVTLASPATLDIAGTPVGNSTNLGGTLVSLIINGGSGCIAAETVGVGSGPVGHLINYPIGPIAINVKPPNGTATILSLDIH